MYCLSFADFELAVNAKGELISPTKSVKVAKRWGQIIEIHNVGSFRLNHSLTFISN